VPPGIRGFYTAGILATLRPRSDASDITVLLRFLVPVLTEVQGRPMRHNIKLEGIGMELVKAVGGKPATTTISMDISNNGGTYSRLKAFAKVRGFWDGHWREVTEAEFIQTSIIPGVKFKLKTDIKRSLPSGKYKLSGVLYVDGRRAKRIVEKEINFVGDTSITKVATDAPLDVLPSNVIINCRPGATRTAAIKIRNASDETVNIQTGLALPGNLRGVAFGDLKGDDLDCTEWVKIEPESFTLRSMSQQSIRITATMPKSAAMHPCYYALLGIFSTYPDGQKGGVTTAHICVTDESISTEPFVHGMKLSPALKEGSQYYIVARFGNFGRIHFTPIRCRAAVVDAADPTGRPRAVTALSSSKSDIMLPLEIRDFSGIIDFSNVSAGTYRLAAVLEYAPGEVATKQIGIRVLPQGQRKIVEVVKLEEELGEKIKVRW